MRRRVRP